MNLRLRTGCLYSALLALSLACPPQAQATLGEGADSIAKDGKALSAAKAVTTSHAHYQVQELVSDATAVREYLTPEGIVFAVAWNGLVHPDLTALLGSYAEEYQIAKQQLPRRHGRKSTQVESARIVVETWGHMRDLHGRAYIPDLVPQEVDLDEIH